MRIEWDELKRQANLQVHGLDFADLDPEFFERGAVLPAKQGRRMVIGTFAGRVIAVIAADLGEEAVSVISMRRASRKERWIAHDRS